MTIYSIFSPVDAPALVEPAAVPEKFSWLAFLLPPLFLAGHRMGRYLLGFIVVALALIVLSTYIGDAAAFWLYALFALWIGFEAPALRRMTLKRRGFAYQTDVIAGAADAAKVEWLKRRQGRVS